MKRFLALTLLSTLLLSACMGEQLSEDTISAEDLAATPELEEPALAWQGLVDAYQAGDCEAAMEELHRQIEVDDECAALFGYFDDNGVPTIEWSRSDWNATGIKVKVYELDGPSIGSFALVNGEWKVEKAFW